MRTGRLSGQLPLVLGSLGLLLVVSSGSSHVYAAGSPDFTVTALKAECCSISNGTPGQYIPGTYFTVVATAPAGGPLNYAWNSSLSCGKFAENSTAPSQASWWFHLGANSCPGSGFDYSGTVTVVISDGTGSIICTDTHGSSSFILPGNDCTPKAPAASSTSSSASVLTTSSSSSIAPAAPSLPLIPILVAAIIVLAGGAGVWFFLRRRPPSEPGAAGEAASPSKDCDELRLKYVFAYTVLEAELEKARAARELSEAATKSGLGTPDSTTSPAVIEAQENLFYAKRRYAECLGVPDFTILPPEEFRVKPEPPPKDSEGGDERAHIG